MSNIVVNSGGQKFIAKKVRYFEYQNSNYLIYTLDEVDIESYVKLYIIRFKGDIEQYIDDNEWISVKEIIQKIVREIKMDQIVSFTDLVCNIEQIDNNYARPFKLKSELVNIMSYNKDENNGETKEEQPVDSKEAILKRLEEFLKNPVMDEPEEDKTPIKSTHEIIKDMEQNNNIEVSKDMNLLQKELNDIKMYCEDLKHENHNLQIEVNNLKDKLEYLKGVIRDV